MSYYHGMGKGYELACPVAQTLDVIGEKWTFLILRDLLLEGPRKFQDFEKSLTGIAPNTLSARLKGLQANGIIDSQLYSEHPPRAEYFLTEKGKEIGPIAKAMHDWGMRHRGLRVGPLPVTTFDIEMRRNRTRKKA